VSENCAAIAPDLLTSELFGHKKGAFTGATEDRRGLFEVANGGTLFLDEIGDCPADLQTRLLRVLDQGEIRRVGDNKPIKVDVRIIAATHHDLEQDVRENRFRQDLFYRLSVFTVRTPALRERREDISLLAQHFVENLARNRGKVVRGLTNDTIDLLAAHDFPGNVRELQNEIERAVALLGTGARIRREHLSEKVAGSGRIQGSVPAQLPPPVLPARRMRDAPAVVEPDPADVRVPLRQARAAFEERYIDETLRAHGGNVSRTASVLGLSRAMLHKRLRATRGRVPPR
jgi:Nif-specific regulatory protein